MGIKVGRERAAKARAGDAVTLGIRPEDLRVSASDAPATGGGQAGDALTGRVVLVERLGGTSHVHFDVASGTNRMMASVGNDNLPEVGETITVRVPPERVHLFGSDGKTISS
jgi:ABC-type sugar transport system ATPase subunit